MSHFNDERNKRILRQEVLISVVTFDLKRLKWIHDNNDNEMVKHIAEIVSNCLLHVRQELEEIQCLPF